MYVCNAFTTDYVVTYYARPVVNNEGVTYRPAREFSTKNGLIENPERMRIATDDIRAHYDEYKNKLLRRRVKIAGVVEGLALVVGAVATGLELGLKRTGTDLQRDARIRAKTLRQSTPATPGIPWTNLEAATGKSVVWSSENLMLIGLGFAFVTSLRER